ncbi:MAG: aldehyde dehydrogenase, partial [Pseudoflavonifractor sp.]
MDFTALISAQREYFNSGMTRGIALRLIALDKLEKAILAREGDLLAALKTDLGKAEYESYACEIGIVLSELRFAKKHLQKWAAPQKRPSPLALFPAHSRVLAEPYGVVLIMSPWNYPVQLTLVPLVAALAAGNCALVKPSAYTPHVAAVLGDLLAATFPPEQVALVQGGRAENAALLEGKFDYIFFTGSTAVGKTVMHAAAEHLTPLTLELGGKSPVILAPDADLPLAARRLCWAKFVNAGQTCVAPDHLYVPAPLRDRLVEELGKQIKILYGSDPLHSPDLPKIVTEKHFNRICGLIDPAKIAHGGQTDPENRRIAPTILQDVAEQDPIMQEEIFGPLLPVLTYEDLDTLLIAQQKKPRPLALYLFTKDPRFEARALQAVPSGGVCVNDAVVHLATSHLPFGGVGESGMGSCHGKAGFDTFTHYRSLVHRGKLDLPLRYPPY